MRGTTPTTRRSPCTGGRQLGARVSAEEYAEAEAKAAAAGLTIPEFVRRLVREVAKVRP